MGKREEIGRRIRTMRKSRNMTQEDLAKSIDQSASSITMYETGRRQPDFETLEAMADVFNVTLGSIISGETRIETPIFIPDTQQFSHAVQYMTPEEYDELLDIFKKAYQRMREKGVEVL